MSLEKVHYMHVALFERQPYGTEAAELWFDPSHMWKLRNREKKTRTKHKLHLKGFSQVSFPIQTLKWSEILADYLILVQPLNSILQCLFTVNTGLVH